MAETNKKIKIHVLHCGQVVVPQLIPFGFTGKYYRRTTLPVSAYLIESSKGKVLVDTGWHTLVRTHPVKEMGVHAYPFSKPVLSEGQAVNEQLARMGIMPDDLDYVTFTHLDADHAGGVKLVSAAKNILVDADELASANKSRFRYRKHMWQGVNITTFQMQSGAYGPHHRCYDLFGDESVILVSTPGHSKGHVVVMVRNNGKYVLLAGDVGYGKKSWEQMVLPGIIDDKPKEIQALQWLQKMAADPNCLDALAVHDADVVPHVIEF